MHDDGIKLLDLMFREGETVCVHHNKFAYHSIPKECAFDETVTMVPKDPTQPYEYVKSDDLIFCALNPIKGFRNDQNCYKYRNFLVEMDAGALDLQLKHIRDIGLPYSAAIFSGSKSLHFLISLDQDLPNEEMWRLLAEWTLKAIPLADQSTKNPSRSIRIPGAYRPGGKLQEFYDYRGTVKLQNLIDWLKMRPDCRPIRSEKRLVNKEFNGKNLKKWVIKRLKSGLDPTKGRNQQWFGIACEFALAGFSEDGTLGILEDYFTPERDFPMREFRSIVKSAFKHIYETRNQRE